MVDYIVTNSKGEFVLSGDRVTDAFGNTGTFEFVKRGTEFNGVALVVVDGRERLADVFNITVETIEDEYEEDQYDLNWYADESEYSGYYPEDEYNDLDREYDDIY